MTETDLNATIEKLPHRGTMRLIDKVIRIDGMCVETQTVVDGRRAFLFGNGTHVESYIGVELIAQSAILPLIAGSAKQEALGGMIIQVKSFQSFHRLTRLDSTLTTTCEVEQLRNGTVAMATGRVSVDGAELCKAQVTFTIQGGGMK